MNADEIVKELMEIAEKLDRLDDSISGDVVANAANLIEFTLASLESLSAKLAEIEAEAQNAIAINKALRKQLSASKRREKAAVECINEIDRLVKMRHDTGLCKDGTAMLAEAEIRKWRGPQDKPND